MNKIFRAVATCIRKKSDQELLELGRALRASHLPRRRRGVDAELMYLRLGNMQLEIFGNINAETGRPEPMSFPDTIAYTGFQHFCVRVDDMADTIAALKSAGIPIFLGPNTNPTLNRTFIHIKDPEGNDVEIVKWEG